MDKHSLQLIRATAQWHKLPADMQSYVPKTNDRLMEKRTGEAEERLLTVLLVRNDHVIAQYLTGVKTGSKRVIKFPAFAGTPPVINDVQFTVYMPEGLKSTAPIAATEQADSAVAAGEEAIAAEPLVAKKKRGEGPTKMSKCREIYAANPGLNKVDMKALFVSEAGCTIMGANTYLLTIMKG